MNLAWVCFALTLPGWFFVGWLWPDRIAHRRLQQAIALHQTTERAAAVSGRQKAEDTHRLATQAFAAKVEEARAEYEGRLVEAYAEVHRDLGAGLVGEAVNAR